MRCLQPSMQTLLVRQGTGCLAPRRACRRSRTPWKGGIPGWATRAQRYWCREVSAIRSESRIPSRFSTGRRSFQGSAGHKGLPMIESRNTTTPASGLPDEASNGILPQADSLFDTGPGRRRRPASTGPNQGIGRGSVCLEHHRSHPGTVPEVAGCGWPERNHPKGPRLAEGLGDRSGGLLPGSCCALRTGERSRGRRRNRGRSHAPCSVALPVPETGLDQPGGHPPCQGGLSPRQHLSTTVNRALMALQPGS